MHVMDEQERKLLDHVGTPIFVLEIDGDGEPIYAAFNKCACDVTGMAASDVVGKTAKEIYPGRMGQIAYDRHIEASRRKQIYTYELWLPLEGQRRRVRTTLDPVLDEAANVVRLIGTSADISAEQTVREAQADSVTLHSEIEEFVNLAAHDLRSPMRNVQYLADMIRTDFTDLGDGKLQLLDMLESVSKNAVKLISDILNHAHATNATTNETVFDFSSLCADILVMLDPTGRHEAQIDGGWVAGDQTSTQIVVRNLIDNAFKHCGRDVVALEIGLANRGDGMFAVTVRDNGVGFADPALALLDGGKLAPGSGFGLFGIRRLIRARGGTILAETPTNGSGAAITFTLPGQLVEALRLSARAGQN